MGSGVYCSSRWPVARWSDRRTVREGRIRRTVTSEESASPSGTGGGKSDSAASSWSEFSSGCGPRASRKRSSRSLRRTTGPVGCTSPSASSRKASAVATSGFAERTSTRSSWASGWDARPAPAPRESSLNVGFVLHPGEFSNGSTSKANDDAKEIERHIQAAGGGEYRQSRRAADRDAVPGDRRSVEGDRVLQTGVRREGGQPVSDAGRLHHARRDPDRRFDHHDVRRVSGRRFEIPDLGGFDDGEPPHQLERCRQTLEPGPERRREANPPAGEPVLGRAIRQAPGSLRPHLVRLHAGQDERAGKGGETAGGLRDDGSG